jgi:hypothetical protein
MRKLMLLLAAMLTIVLVVSIPAMAHDGYGYCGDYWSYNGSGDWAFDEYQAFEDVSYPDGSYEHWHFYDHYDWDPNTEDYKWVYGDWRYCGLFPPS